MNAFIVSNIAIIIVVGQNCKDLSINENFRENTLDATFRNCSFHKYFLQLLQIYVCVNYKIRLCLF